MTASEWCGTCGHPREQHVREHARGRTACAALRGVHAVEGFAGPLPAVRVCPCDAWAPLPDRGHVGLWRVRVSSPCVGRGQRCAIVVRLPAAHVVGVAGWRLVGLERMSHAFAITGVNVSDVDVAAGTPGAPVLREGSCIHVAATNEGPPAEFEGFALLVPS